MSVCRSITRSIRRVIDRVVHFCDFGGAVGTYLVSDFEAESIADILTFEASSTIDVADFELNGYTA